MIAALSIIAIAVIGGGRGGGIAGFQTTAPTITTTTRLRRLFSSSFDVNNDWVIEDDDDDDDDDNNGLGDYPRTTTAKSKTTNTRISENRRKRERRKRNEVVDNDDVVRDDVDDDVRSYFATCIPGLHDTLASELRALGANDVETNGKSGVRFSGSTQIGLLSLLWCRTAHRIMELVASSYYYSSPSSSSTITPSNNMDDEFTSGIRNRDDLYQFIRSAVHIPSLLGNGSGGLLTLSVSTIYAGSFIPKDISHGHFTALTVKNALVDAVREMRDDGSRPDVDVIDSDVPLVLVLRGRNVVDGGEEGRRQRRYGRNRNNKSNKFDDRYGGALNKGDEWETVADVDIYRCLHSGGSLHRRGYRRALDNKSSSGSEVNDDDDDDDDDELSSSPIHRAAMKETLAAGLLLEAGWDKLISAAKVDGLGAVLVDPMTGSATLATEAALIACDIAPGLSRIGWLPSPSGIGWLPSPRLDEQQHRDSGNNNAIIGNDNKHQRPPCTRWKGFDTKGEWHTILIDATKRAKLGMEWARSNNNVRILCNERDVRAVILAKSSIRNTGIDDIVSLNVGDCANWNLGGVGANGGVLKGRTIFVCNPPWGLRLTDDIDESWVSLREFLRREAVGCESWVLSGNKDLTKILRMKKSRSVVLKTADEDLRWLQYHIFQKSEVSEYNQSR